MNTNFYYYTTLKIFFIINQYLNIIIVKFEYKKLIYRYK